MENRVNVHAQKKKKQKKQIVNWPLLALFSPPLFSFAMSAWVCESVRSNKKRITTGTQSEFPCVESTNESVYGRHS